MTTETQRASERITEEVTAWPGVEAGIGRRGEFGFTVGGREIGHLHGDHAAHFGFPKRIWAQLLEQGRVERHPIDQPGWAARRIEDEADVREAIALLRLNYDRAVARHGIPSASGPSAESMATAIPGLYASAPEPLPFAPSLAIRAFLLRRQQGNLLLYSTAGLESDAEAIADLGGISRQYLSHRHEAMFASDLAEAPLFVHEADRDAVAEAHRVRGAFSRRHALDEDFEAIPVPGHTPGATAYLWDSGEHRVLFTGDTIYLDQGEWVAAVLESSDRDRYVDSLASIRELEFDLLVPWATSVGQPFYAATDGEEARRRIDAILARLRRGGNR